jgi:hypothetical protein
VGIKRVSDFRMCNCIDGRKKKNRRRKEEGGSRKEREGKEKGKRKE